MDIIYYDPEENENEENNNEEEKLIHIEDEDNRTKEDGPYGT